MEEQCEIRARIGAVTFFVRELGAELLDFRLFVRKIIADPKVCLVIGLHLTELAHLIANNCRLKV